MKETLLSPFVFIWFELSKPTTLFFSVPVPIHISHIMGGIVGLTRTSLLDELSWNTAPNLTRTNLCSTYHQRACGYNGALAHLTVVEQSASHADKTMVVNGTGMHSGIMANGDITANVQRTNLISGVQHGTVLHICTVPM